MSWRAPLCVLPAAVIALTALTACGEDGQPLSPEQCRDLPLYDVRKGYPDSLDLDELDKAGCLTKPGHALSPTDNAGSGGSKGKGGGSAGGGSAADAGATDGAATD